MNGVRRPKRSLSIISFAVLIISGIWLLITLDANGVMQLGITCALKISCPPTDHEASTKGNMHAIRLGVEQFAGDHKGNYPLSLLASDFVWDKYIPTQRKNPFDPALTDSNLIEENIKLDLKPGVAVYHIAQTDKRPFRGVGMIRYYVDRRTRSSYAITASLRNGAVIQESSVGPNYVLHN